ncbi:unnamed protein product [Phyllotreta striolata]|uniref:ATP synthase subunit s-like protein n=1 Tax=Phyllotreta striolata TaxID=444603 RepID=A0A9N9XKS6_PHYSR|nr:unnamed protein product [Phyllotreta striolata]
MINTRSIFQFSRISTSLCCRLSSSKDTSVVSNVSESEIAVQKKYDPKDVKPSDMEVKLGSPSHMTSIQKEAQYYKFLKLFHTEKSQRSVMQQLQAPIDFTPSGIRNWWARKKDEHEIISQSYLPQRNQMLGNELAAAHFIVHRGGAVKFYNDAGWIKADENNNYVLPRHFQDDRILEAIDCTNMKLMYEGLVNLADLQDVKWLSLNGCENIDDWCLDRISNLFSHSLIYLDLRNCTNITSRGLATLYRLDHLKTLYLDDFYKSTIFELTCLLLQEAKPDLEITSDPVNFEIK